MVNLVAINDLSAAAVGGIWNTIFDGGKNMGDAAMSHAIISIAARMLSQTDFVNKMGNVSEKGANHIIVGLLSALNAYRKRGNISRGVLTGMSVDALSEEILEIVEAGLNLMI